MDGCTYSPIGFKPGPLSRLFPDPKKIIFNATVIWSSVNKCHLESEISIVEILDDVKTDSNENDFENEKFVHSNVNANFPANLSSEDESSDLDEEGYHQDILADSSGLIVTVHDRIQPREENQQCMDEWSSMSFRGDITDLPGDKATQHHEPSDDSAALEIAEAASEGSFTWSTIESQSSQHAATKQIRSRARPIAEQSYFPRSQTNAVTTMPDLSKETDLSNGSPKSCIIS